MTQARWSMLWILGSIAVLVVIAAIAAGSYHVATNIDSNLKAAGINLRELHPYQPPAHPPG
jgi:hypothetical protein